jgi:hypothetical protein
VVTYRWGTDFYDDVVVLKKIGSELSFQLMHLDVIEQWKAAVKREFSVYIDQAVAGDVAVAKAELDEQLHNDMDARFNTKSEEIEETLETYSKMLGAGIERMDRSIETFDEILETETINMANNIKVLEARMDTFTHLPEDSGASDAELTDIRVGADGTLYGSAGTAVRKQFDAANTAIKSAQTIFTNIAPTLSENAKIAKENGCESEVGEFLNVRIVSYTNYGSYYVNLHIPETLKKIIVLQKVKRISGDYSNYPHVYCYGSDNKMINGATTIKRGFVTINDVEYVVNCVSLVENTASIGIGCYSMRENGVCEVDTNPIIFDVSNLSDDVVIGLHDMLATEYIRVLYDELHGNVPYHTHYSDEAIHSADSDHADYADVSSRSHSCYLSEPPSRTIIEEANDWTSLVSKSEDGFVITPTATWGGIGLLYDNFVIGNQYLVIWQGANFDKVGFVKKSGNAWNHISTVSVVVNDITYYYGCVSAMEDDQINRILLHTGVGTDPVTITDVTLTELGSNIVVDSELVKTIISGESVYIPSLNKKEIGNLQKDVAEIKPKAHSHSWMGKNVLFIGDSLTAAKKYQKTIASILGINVHNHCLGGAGIIQTIDGNNEGTITPITAELVSGKDLIIFYAGYNNRGVPDGAVGDCYSPNGGDRTIAGYMQYAINRIFECLAEANNLTCKIMIVTVDCAGKYDYIDADGYDEYPAGSGQSMETLANIQKAVAEYNSLACCDLWHTSGINRYTWKMFGANPNAYIENPGSSSAPYPHNGDQLHKSDAGYVRIGEVITGSIIKAYGN